MKVSNLIFSIKALVSEHIQNMQDVRPVFVHKLLLQRWDLARTMAIVLRISIPRCNFLYDF